MNKTTKFYRFKVLMKKKSLSSNLIKKASFVELIEKKRDGNEFTSEEIRFIVDSILDKTMPDFQLSALIMAIYFQGMSAQETATLAEEVMLSGDIVDLSKLTNPKIDKYSTGGVGDKTALVLGPLAAACGVIMPTMHSINEEFYISNIAKLSSIPGFKSEFPLNKIIIQLKEVGCAMLTQEDGLVPVDNKIYNMRKQTGTVASLPLITASVLSKKLAEGAESLVVDVKWGNGSFIKELEQAKQLARSITRVGRSMKKRCVALVTDMNQPLGSCVGTALEIKETIQLLKGEGPEDLQTLILKLGIEIVRLAGVAGSTLSSKQIVDKAIKEGLALQKFKDMVSAQGGDISYIDDPSKFPIASYIKKLPAPKRGYVHTIDANKIAEGVKILSNCNNKIDFSAGVSDIQKIGMQVKQGQALMMIHYNDQNLLDQALDYFKSAFRLAPKRPNIPELIVERVA